MNPILSTDSYKFSHFEQYPDGMTAMQSHFCARGGEFETSNLFGLQPYSHKLTHQITNNDLDNDVEEARIIAEAHGVPFNLNGFRKIVEKYDGYWPVRIKALPEGLVVPVGTPLFTVESVDDADVFFAVSWLETLLSRVWYPSTIATTSRESKKILRKYLEQSSDTPEEIVFKLHDFGGRGVASTEQAGLGGAAHLLSFLGSDTVEGIVLARDYYDEPMAGFSIPAAEHSTVTTWGRHREFDFYKAFIRRNLTERQVPPGVPKLAACVSDSYNLWEAIKFWTEKEQLDQIEASGGTLVIRPDSGEPVETLRNVFEMLKARLGNKATINSKGYWLLPPYLRVIQGDGIDRNSMERILNVLVNVSGVSASNLAFGSGGGLLQNVNRDTQKFAYKCNAAKIGGVWVPVSKDPITDPGKKSRAGYIEDDRLELVYDCGRITRHETFKSIRERMAL